MKDGTAPTISTTNEYSMFQFIRGNRDISPGHLESLKQAINKKNLLPYNPILINEKKQIIDGQHRYTICKELRLPVYYLEVPGLNIHDVMEINTHSRGCRVQDFIDAYIKLGHEEYGKLKKLANDYNTSYAIAAGIMMHGWKNEHDEKSIQSVKDGSFKVMYPEFSALVFENITDLVPYADFNLLTNRYFVRAYARLAALGVDTFDPDVLPKKLRLSGNRITARTNSQMYILQLEDLYNFKNRGRVDLYSKAMMKAA